MNIVLFISLFIIAIMVMYTYVYNDTDNFISTKSLLDGKTYEVREVNKDAGAGIKQITEIDAANRLASIKKDINKLVNYIYAKQMPDSKTATRLHNRWAKVDLKETSLNSKNIAYTINKGQEVHVCIRSDDVQFENYNTTMFVILHELAHVMSESYGHEDEFKQNFTILLTTANKLGLYKLQNFNKQPEMYCGTKIDNTPCSYGLCS
jgi:hypothetical protein